MVELTGAQIERRQHPRHPGKGLVAEIGGKRYEVVDISFGGIKMNGKCAVAGGLINVIIQSMDENLQIAEDKAEVRGRVERVVGELTIIRFSNLTDALIKLIEQRGAD